MKLTIDSDDGGIRHGVVYKKTNASYHVYVDGHTIPCTLSSRLRKPGSSRRSGRSVDTSPQRDPVAVGDEVGWVDTGDGAGMIVDVLPRRNRIARQTAVPMPSAHPFEQVIVANVDQVVSVFALADPAPHWNLLDRYLVSAESENLPALICVTKLDLLPAQQASTRQELQEAVQDYRRIGYPVILVSALTGEGLGDLKQALQGRTSVFLGKSGVGKTSLLNVLQPGLELRVNEVSRATGKGKHTTAHLEMFFLDLGGAIVDTPGVREFGLWDVNEADLALFFPEMRLLVGQCRFGLDCRHNEEPGCAIRKAVMAGQISPRRYQNYMRLKIE